MYSVGGPSTSSRWVSPFGHSRIKACCQLPETYRRLPRPSSAPSCQAIRRMLLCASTIQAGEFPRRRTAVHGVRNNCISSADNRGVTRGPLRPKPKGPHTCFAHMDVVSICTYRLSRDRRSSFRGLRQGDEGNGRGPTLRKRSSAAAPGTVGNRETRHGSGFLPREWRG